MGARQQRSTAGAQLTRIGRVVESNGAAVVRFLPACTNGSCRGCHAAPGRALEIPLTRLAEIGEASAGDSVALEVTAGALGRVAALTFGLPLAALVIGAWLGRHAAAVAAISPDVAAPTVGLVALALVCTIVTRCGDSVARMLKLTAHKVRMAR